MTANEFSHRFSNPVSRPRSRIKDPRIETALLRESPFQGTNATLSTPFYRRSYTNQACIRPEERRLHVNTPVIPKGSPSADYIFQFESQKYRSFLRLCCLIAPFTGVSGEYYQSMSHSLISLEWPSAGTWSIYGDPYVMVMLGISFMQYKIDCAMLVDFRV